MAKLSSFESAFGKGTLVLEANANDTYLSRSSTLKLQVKIDLFLLIYNKLN